MKVSGAGRPKGEIAPRERSVRRCSELKCPKRGRSVRAGFERVAAPLSASGPEVRAACILRPAPSRAAARFSAASMQAEGAGRGRVRASTDPLRRQWTLRTNGPMDPTDPTEQARQTKSASGRRTARGTTGQRPAEQLENRTKQAGCRQTVGGAAGQRLAKQTNEERKTDEGPVVRRVPRLFGSALYSHFLKRKKRIVSAEQSTMSASAKR